MSLSKDYDYLFRIVLIGDANAGKTSIMLRLTEDIFKGNMIFCPGIDFKIHYVTLADKIAKLQLWDTAGCERFNTITSSYYRGAHGIILVYNIDDRKSFTNIEKWYEQINKLKDKNIMKILIGNKCDLEDRRQVSYEEGKAYADSIGVEFLETSAKEGTNVEEALFMLVGRIKERADARKEEGNGESDNIKISTNRKGEGKGSRCC